MNRDGELAIYEVYYREDGQVQGYSEFPTHPAGTTLDELKENCALYIASMKKPILPYV